MDPKADFFDARKLSRAQAALAKDYKKLVSGAAPDRRIQLSLDLFGPRGSGKSSLALGLCGLHIPDLCSVETGCVLHGLYQSTASERKYLLDISEGCDFSCESTGVGILVPCNRAISPDCFDYLLQQIRQNQSVFIFVTMGDMASPASFGDAVAYAVRLRDALEDRGVQSVVAPVFLAPQRVTRASLSRVCAMLLEREETRTAERELVRLRSREDAAFTRQDSYFKDIVWGSLARRGLISEGFKAFLGGERFERVQAPEMFQLEQIQSKQSSTQERATPQNEEPLTIVLDVSVQPSPSRSRTPQIEAPRQSGGSLESHPDELRMLKRDPRQKKVGQEQSAGDMTLFSVPLPQE